MKPAHAVLTATEDPSAAYTRRLFDSFYQVFAAERQPERAIFWCKRNAKHATVWHVRNLEDRHPQNDMLVGRTINDDDAIRILIGNWAAGCKMTTVRWELFNDLTLTQFADMGRFDYFDLAGGVDRDKARFLRQQNIYPAGNWDFDAVAQMHTCLKCHQPFNRKSILYLPNQPCENCGLEPTHMDASRVIYPVMTGYVERLSRITTFSSGQLEMEFAVQHFVDPIPNSVIYWLLIVHHGGYWQPTAQELFGQESESGYGENFEMMRRRTLFNFMASEGTRDLFRHYMTERCGDCSTILATWQTVGEALQTPLEQHKENRKRDRSYGDRIDTAIDLARKWFPVLFNQIVLGHLSFPERNS